MEMIPVNETDIRPYVGKHVCVVLRDGAKFYGVIHDITDGRLWLGPDGETADVDVKKYKKKMKSRTSVSKRKRVQTNSYPHDSFYFSHPAIKQYGHLLAFELSFIAFLFVIPFFPF